MKGFVCSDCGVESVGGFVSIEKERLQVIIISKLNVSLKYNCWYSWFWDV